MMPRTLRPLALPVLASLLLAVLLTPARAAGLPAGTAAALKAAKAGTTVTLPAGTFDINEKELEVPAGVTLQGAGYDRTILQVHGGNGLVLRDANGAQLADLTIRDATAANLLIEHSDGVIIRRVRLMGGLVGLQAARSAGLRVEAVATANTRAGIIVNACDGAVVVNCTMLRATSACLSLSGGKAMRAFNNVMASAPLGVVVAPGTADLLLDHNLYQVNRVGKLSDTPPESVWSWRDQSGYDVHSVQQAVQFENEEAGAVKPVTALAWAPGLLATGLWGVTELGGAAAPATDLGGLPTVAMGEAWKKLAPVNVGALNARLREEAPDGTFTIASSEGLKSAALYDADGRLVANLFQTLPLPKGQYPYWLPTRDWQGRPLAAGAYELRLTAADLRLRPVGTGLAGTTALSPTVKDHGAIQAQQPAFDSKGRLAYSLGWSESGLNVRAFDDTFTTARWSFAGTTAHAGFAADGQGLVYSLRTTGKEYSLLKLDEESGATKEFKPGEYIRYYSKEFSPKVSGLAALGDQLFVADTGANKVLATSAADPTFTQAFAVPAPSSPCGDAQRHLLWVLSANTAILGLNPADGSVQVTIPAPVAGLHSFAIAGNRLAALSYTTGKVHLFDLSDPTHPKALNTLAAGFGQVQDAFLVRGRPLDDGTIGRVALRADGAVAVADLNGVKFFGADGKLARELTGGWFNSYRLGDSDPVSGQQVLDPSTGRSWRLNAKTGTSTAEASWDGGTPISCFRAGGQVFGLFHQQITVDDNGKPAKRPVSLIQRIAPDCHTTPLLAFTSQLPPAGELSFCATFPGGKLPETYAAADWQPITTPDGRHIAANSSGITFAANGDAQIDTGAGFLIVPLKGLTPAGMLDYALPTFTTTDPKVAGLPVIKYQFSESGTIISPYDLTTVETPGGPPNRVPAYLRDGGPIRLTSMKTGRMAALTGNWGASDAAAFDAAGKLRWFLPLPEVNSAIGPYVVDDLIYFCGVTSSETQIVDRDGLILGRCGQPAGLPWGGKWLDNTLQFSAFKGNDGKPYVLYGNFNECCLYWFAVQGLDQAQKQVLKVTVSPAQAARLGALPRPAPAKAAQPPPTRITIKRSKEMAVDGDLQKWRALLPIPQAIVTPDAGSGITGPADCSALLRFAHDGNSLYVQCIKFDNAVVMFQPADLFFKQDGFEMAINSFASGFKFNVTRVKEQGDIIMRDRFYFANLKKFLDPAKAPRKITVLESAETVSERHFIEDVYGVDLSKSKVIITEFKLPINDDTYEGDTKIKPSMAAGATVWLGALIDDSDVPGGDIQNYLAWPATYGTFSGPETGALCTFE